MMELKINYCGCDNLENESTCNDMCVYIFLKSTYLLSDLYNFFEMMILMEFCGEKKINFCCKILLLPISENAMMLFA
jgi:hypothetical protein